MKPKNKLYLPVVLLFSAVILFWAAVIVIMIINI